MKKLAEVTLTVCVIPSFWQGIFNNRVRCAHSAAPSTKKQCQRPWVGRRAMAGSERVKTAHLLVRKRRRRSRRRPSVRPSGGATAGFGGALPTYLAPLLHYKLLEQVTEYKRPLSLTRSLARESWRRHEGLEKSLLEPARAARSLSLGGQASKIPSPPPPRQQQQQHSSSSLYYSFGGAVRGAPPPSGRREHPREASTHLPLRVSPRARRPVQLTPGGRCVRWDAVAATVAMMSA
jgi:hypothetical protein